MVITIQGWQITISQPSIVSALHMVACTSKPWHKQKSAMICIWNASRKLVCWRLGVEFVVLIGNGRTFMRQDLGEGVRSLAAYCSQERPWPFSLCSFAFCCSFEQFCFSACSPAMVCSLAMSPKWQGQAITAEMSAIMSPCWPVLFRYFVSGRKLPQKMIQITDGVPRAPGSCNPFPEGPPASHQPLPVFSPVNTFLPYWSNSLCAPSGSLRYPPERMGTDLLRLCRFFLDYQVTNCLLLK